MVPSESQPPAKADRRSFSERLWKLLASVKLALVLLVVIALLSLIGVLLPQGWRPELYVAKYGQSWWRVFELTGFYDTYHSWWYRLALVLLTANLFVCTVERLGGTVKAAFSRQLYTEQELFTRLPDFRRIAGQVPAEQAYEILTTRLKKSLFGVTGARRDDTFFVAASRGSVARLAAPVIHLGVIVVLIGGFVGAQFGFSTVIDVREGERTDVPHREFELKLEDFQIVFAPSGRIKDFYSTLTVFEDGEERLTKTIEVNDPLRYAGVGVYQSSYGEFPRAIASGLLSVAMAGSTATVVAPFREAVRVPGFPGLSVEILDYAADFRISLPEREVVSATWEPRNPAVKVRVANDGIPVMDDWVFLFHPSMHGEQDTGFGVRFLDYDPHYYSGLQISSNPGLSTIWVGFALISVGLIPLLIMLNHERVWSRIAPGETPGTCEVLIAGSAHRWKTQWKNRFSAIVNDWQKRLSG